LDKALAESRTFARGEYTAALHLGAACRRMSKKSWWNCRG
jgi:hypothetical protein